jgi:indolepyruvate ferredoxin oxidoreductase beta subunit
MKFDMIVSGVGGQGILSISFVVDNAALEENFRFKQSEVHGMAQRGGAVVSHLRVSDREIYSDLVAEGAADLILSMEPLETLRYLHYLAPGGEVVTSVSPFVNIPNYPDMDGVLSKLQEIDGHTLVNAEDLARAAGSHYAQNIVMLGAANHLIPMQNKTLEKYIGILFKPKGEKIVNVNINAFRYGAMAGQLYRDLLAAGMEVRDAAIIATKLAADTYEPEVLLGWIELCQRDNKNNMLSWLSGRKGLLPGGKDTIAALKALDFAASGPDSFEASCGK